MAERKPVIRDFAVAPLPTAKCAAFVGGIPVIPDIERLSAHISFELWPFFVVLRFTAKIGIIAEYLPKP